MMTTDRVAVSTKNVPAVALMTKNVPVVDSMKTVPVVVTVVLTTVPVAALMTKRNLVGAARVMFARKTRFTTARKLLAKSA
jgi:hypothetical protein